MITSPRQNICHEPLRAIPSSRLWRTMAVLVALSAFVACGGKQSDAKSAPSSGGAKAGSCEPMPELGSSCETEGKQCLIVCHEESDRCAQMVCQDGSWEYAEEANGDDAE